MPLGPFYQVDPPRLPRVRLDGRLSCFTPSPVKLDRIRIAEGFLIQPGRHSAAKESANV